ncbi:MAG: DUF559 domain-containing protein [Draconibacterium sp.]|nr:DUF559 domain-containing protein [Draconibacterium sp.]
MIIEKINRNNQIKNLDFYYSKIKMIIELDGEPHFIKEQADNDKKGDKRLTELGYKVFMYENLAIFDHPNFIFDDIKSLITTPG